MSALHHHRPCTADGECPECDQYAADEAAERQWEAQQAQRHAESGMGDTDDGSERWAT